MVRQNHHAYHDFSRPRRQRSPLDPSYFPPDEEDEVSLFELNDHDQINARLARLEIQQSQQPQQPPTKLIDRIPSQQVPETMSFNGNSREPVPIVPEERDLAQAAVDEGNGGVFRTFQDTCPPPADCQYTVIDQGVTGPEFLRASMYNVPHSSRLRSMTQLPLSLYVRPFAKAEVPLADFSAFDGEEMPPRCSRCRAYMNPSMRFTGGGVKFVCNLCLYVNTTPTDYYQPVGPDGKRIDWEERPELAFGTYDFAVVAPKGERSGQGSGQGEEPVNTLFGSPILIPGPEGNDEMRVGIDNKDSVYGKPAIPEFRHVFCCECTRESTNKGVLSVFAESVIASLSCLQPNVKIAIMVFDSHINYFRINALNKCEMLVCAASNVMIPPDVLIDPVTQREPLLDLLNRLSSFFDGTKNRESCLGYAIETVLALPHSNEGGRITAMFTALPVIGVSRLTMRDHAIAGVTPNDAPVHKELFEPASPFYKKLARRLADNGWGCDMMAIPTTGYLDMTTLSHVSQTTGGRVFHYPRFQPERDSKRIIGDILAITATPITARNASLRIRTSTGLQIDEMFGCSDKPRFMDTNTTVVATMKYDGNLDPKLDAHFQVAVLYTSNTGEKRVRVMNLLAGVTVKIKSVLKFVDNDVIMATITRQIVSQMGKHGIPELREATLSKIENIFGASRLHAGQGMPLSHMLMPTNLRQLPMQGLAFTKSICIGSRSFSSDARSVNAVYLSNATANQLALALYPRIYDIGVTPTPPASRARFEDICTGSRAFVIFDGQHFYIWLGDVVSPSVLKSLFGVAALSEVSPTLCELPVLDNPLNVQARELCASLALHVERSWLPVQIVRQKLDGAEYQLRQLMLEDTINYSLAYINYIVRLHNFAKAYKEKEGWF